MHQCLAQTAVMSLLLAITGSTQRKLARQVHYLRVENEILRSKLPGRIKVTPKERQRLVKFGGKLGKALSQAARRAAQA